VGAGFISVRGADSLQIDPPEPTINHFNSATNDFRTKFATQAKAGLRYKFMKHFRLFGEYRFLYLSSPHFTFGSTKYPTHVPTSKWKVDLDGLKYNAFAFGLDILL
jgi:hypothetical protein